MENKERYTPEEAQQIGMNYFNGRQHWGMIGATNINCISRKRLLEECLEFFSAIPENARSSIANDYIASLRKDLRK